MKGTLTFSAHTFRPSEKVRNDYEGCEVEEVEPQTFHITVPLEVDPENPYKAMEDYQAETGEDCWEVFTIKLEDGSEFTEEDYEG